MAISCLKTSFLGPENQFFSIFEKNFPQKFFLYFFAELQIWQKLVLAKKIPNIMCSRPEQGPIFDFWGDSPKK